jgi:hypothetical protein
MVYSSNFVEKAAKLRKEGFSYEEISKELKIAKSSAYLWCKQVILNQKAKERLKKRLAIGMVRAKEVLRIKRDKKIKEIIDRVKLYISKLKSNNEINKLLCSFLYWAEGEKTTASVTFINSNPTMISTFLKLLRSSFVLDEKKFRCLVHIHEYHSNEEIKKYWSVITKIPINQFSKSYLKPHTKKRIRDNYKGTVSIRYYDHKIALELSFIYNMFADLIIQRT